MRMPAFSIISMVAVSIALTNVERHTGSRIDELVHVVFIFHSKGVYDDGTTMFHKTNGDIHGHPLRS